MMCQELLCILLFNHHNPSADISSFEVEAEAYKFQFRINSDENDLQAL